MTTLKFTISKNSCKTDPQYISSSYCKMPGFQSKIRDLAIILEDKGTKSVYYATSTKKGFEKNDPLEFRKIWLEYKTSDKDYEILLQVG